MTEQIKILEPLDRAAGSPEPGSGTAEQTAIGSSPVGGGSSAPDPLAAARQDRRLYDRTLRFVPWLNMLQRDMYGGIQHTLYNLRGILELDDDLRGICWNELTDAVESRTPLPWRRKPGPWRDADDAQLVSYVDTHYAQFPLAYYATALTKVADDRRYHPIRAWFLEGEDWDGTPRVETLLPDYLGAEDTPYVRAVTRKLLAAAVRRMLEPGLKFDQILVLAGPQGIGKSTLISRLGMDWYTDSLSLSDMDDKTAAEKLQGFWLVEIGEMAGMKKADLEKVKAFLSRRDDKFRPAYGRRVSSHPRQCVFFGTTNEESGYLRDVTGNRRFWTVRCTGEGPKKPWELTGAEVRQIWMEALELSRDEALYLEPELLEDARQIEREAMEKDDREGLVRAYLELPLPADWDARTLFARRSYVETALRGPGADGWIPREQVSCMEIWCECFGRNQADLTRRDSYAITAILTRIGGWRRVEKTVRLPIYGMQRVFEKKPPVIGDTAEAEKEESAEQTAFIGDTAEAEKEETDVTSAACYTLVTS